MTTISIIQSKNGQFLNVRVPHHQTFIQAAKILRARREKGVWVFLKNQERTVRKVLIEVFGHAGSETEFSDVQVSLKPFLESVDETLEIAGIRILEADNERPCIFLHPGVKILNGEFNYIYQGSHFSPRIRLGKNGATLILRKIPKAMIDKLKNGTSKSWISSIQCI